LEDDVDILYVGSDHDEYRYDEAKIKNAEIFVKIDRKSTEDA